MLLLVLVKGIHCLRIFQRYRILIHMVLRSLWAMIPFMVLVGLSIILFALMNYTIDYKRWKDARELNQGLVQLGENKGELYPRADIYYSMGEQYRMIFGENPVIAYYNTFW